MKKVLCVGDHPLSTTGNGNMMAAILSQIDMAKYQVACFASGISGITRKSFQPLPFLLIDWTHRPDDEVTAKFLQILQVVEFDVLLMVGIDLWQYGHAFQRIAEIKRQEDFKWAAIFPYDLQELRRDWICLINALDFPCVCSRYGLEMLKDHVPGVRYFRPSLYNAGFFKPLKDRMSVRREIFKTLSNDDLLFGFVGANQFRKSTPRFLKAFMEAKKEIPAIRIYLHTEIANGAYNLRQMAFDYGARTGDLLAKEENTRCSAEHMVKIYNGLDCLVNCTLQEGLSWTPLEAMLCGTPVVASDTTAQTELVEDAGLLVPCDELAYVPILTESGQSFVDAKACSVKAIRDAIVKVAKDPGLRKIMRNAGFKKAKKWLEGVSNVNDLLAEATKPEITVTVQDKINKILFVQHSSAGDVLMSTQCFKGIKERHKNMELVYMTQSQYTDIIEGNPYVDEIIEWDPEKAQKYEVVYNPHGEKILPGGFNSLDVKLYSMYPYFCRVEPDEIFIKQIIPEEITLPDEYIVVHTSGGDPVYRTYPHMSIVLKGIDLPAVQLGSLIDCVCHKAIDLRGKLSFRESAWIVAHARGAIVIDSFMSHLCGALGTPVVVLYGPAPARVVGPRIQNGGGYVALEPNMLDVCKSMTRCWGMRNRMGASECTSPCISTLNPLFVRKAFLGLMEKQSERKEKQA